MKKTADNLARAFVGESQARNRYTFYSRIAQKEGYEQISEIFLITAENEGEHAKQFLKMLKELGEKRVEVSAEVPVVLGNTIENLKGAIRGEHHEHSKIYPSFAKIADEEVLKDVAARIRAIAITERHHEERYKKVLKEIENESVFKKKEKKSWVCRKCGYVHEGRSPLENCPSCGHPKNYFQIKCEEY